ncbi:MAG: phosphoglyceromutase [Candidatus Dormibacteraceae bacterium]
MTSRLILLRHGESEWNALDRFTGWVDVGLSPAGEAESARAGELLRERACLPTVLHTSLLRRAIRTAEIALDGCGHQWIPVRRSWRLNERHYGGLQGRNKRQVREQFGDQQFKLWRRSYDEPPPPLPEEDEYSQFDDLRYANLPPEARPRTECLRDVVGRILPYWYDVVVPDLLAGQTVLIVAHGNSLRALVKHLDGISDQAISELNIPTAMPLLYELDDELRPCRSGGEYLDPESAMDQAEAVKQQGQTAP